MKKILQPKYKQIFSIFSIENICYALLCFVSIFFVTNNTLESDIEQKWTASSFLFYCVLLVLLLKAIICGKIILNIKIFINIAVGICTIQALYIVVQEFFIKDMNIHHFGSFQNHSGISSCLCIVLPYLFWKIESNNDKVKLLNILLVILYGYALILSGSRIGLLIYCAIPALMLYKKNTNRPIIQAGIIFCICTFCLLLYFIRPDSANGRLLIWLSSFEAFKDAPFFGQGQGSFRRLYMFYQARYLLLNPESRFNELADTVQFPFNEYIRIIFNWGIIGFGAIISFILLIFKKYISSINIISVSIITIAILSLTSYPFSYPFTWIIVGTYILYALNIKLIKFNKILRMSALLLIIPTINCVNQSYKFYEIKHNWYYADWTNNLNLYADIYNTLKNNPYFLYNYSVRLFLSGDINNSKRIALDCETKFADYDLELLLGDIFYAEKKYDVALKHYNMCANMCPCRFIPLYQMFLIYKKTNNDKQAMIIANKIFNKKIKIPSPTINLIKIEAENYINNLCMK